MDEALCMNGGLEGSPKGGPKKEELRNSSNERNKQEGMMLDPQAFLDELCSPESSKFTSTWNHQMKQSLQQEIMGKSKMMMMATGKEQPQGISEDFGQPYYSEHSDTNSYSDIYSLFDTSPENSGGGMKKKSDKEELFRYDSRYRAERAPPPYGDDFRMEEWNGLIGNSSKGNYSVAEHDRVSRMRPNHVSSDYGHSSHNHRYPQSPKEESQYSNNIHSHMRERVVGDERRSSPRDVMAQPGRMRYHDFGRMSSPVPKQAQRVMYGVQGPQFPCSLHNQDSSYLYREPIDYRRAAAPYSMRKRRKSSYGMWSAGFQGYGAFPPSRYSSLEFIKGTSHKNATPYGSPQAQVAEKTSNNHLLSAIIENGLPPSEEQKVVLRSYCNDVKKLDMENITVFQLKTLMKEYGLNHGGKKSELIDYIRSIQDKIEKLDIISSAVAATKEEEGEERTIQFQKFFF